MGEQTNDLDPSCLVRKATLAPVDIWFPCEDVDGIASAVLLGVVGTPQTIALDGVWMGVGGRLPVCMQPVAITTLTSDTYSYTIVGEDWFGEPLTRTATKAAATFAGRSITACYSKITSISVTPVVITNPGVDTISFGWRAANITGAVNEQSSFPLPIQRGFFDSTDFPTVVNSCWILDPGGAGVYGEFAGGPGARGPTTSAAAVDIQNGSFRVRMDATTQPTLFGRLAVGLSQDAIKTRY
jgi:hypothetical protein